MQKSLAIGFILLMFLLGVVSVASPVSADLIGDSLRISVYSIKNNYTEATFANDTGLTFKVVFDSTEFNPNDETFYFTIYTNTTNPSQTVPIFSSGNFDYVVDSETNVSNWDFLDKYNQANTDLTNCKIQRGQFESFYNKCLSDLSVYTGANATKCTTDLNTCKVTLTQKDVELSGKQTEIETAKKSTEDTKNSKWLFGFGGLILGAGGFYFYNKRKSGSPPADKSANEWPKNQVG